MVDPVPAGLEGRVIPYLMIDGASAAIDFYVAAFGASENYRLAMPDGSIGHADLSVFGAPVYLADAPDDMDGDAANPVKLGGTSVLLHQYVADQFYGDRSCVIVDPFGHQWALHTHVRDMSPDEIAAAAAELGG